MAAIRAAGVTGSPTMVRSTLAALIRARGRARLASVLALSLLVVPGVAGCSSAPSVAPAQTAAVGVTGMHDMANGMSMSSPEMDAAWIGRPAYTKQDSQTEVSYAYAFRNWNVIEWMPCYCGCGATGHESNLDCYFRPMAAGSTKVAFEEHASFCQVCQQITLKARQLQDQGKSLLEIRRAVDRQFGAGGAPGTDTPMPPA